MNLMTAATLKAGSKKGKKKGYGKKRKGSGSRRR